jgi:hypothetical protein
MRIPRTQGNLLSVCGEYSEFRVVCGRQNLLRVRGKNLCVHREDAKRPTKLCQCISQLTIIQILNFLRFFLFSLYGIYKALKPAHATVPLNMESDLQSLFGLLCTGLLIG